MIVIAGPWVIGVYRESQKQKEIEQRRAAEEARRATNEARLAALKSDFESRKEVLIAEIERAIDTDQLDEAKRRLTAYVEVTDDTLNKLRTRLRVATLERELASLPPYWNYDNQRDSYIEELARLAPDNPKWTKRWAEAEKRRAEIKRREIEFRVPLARSPDEVKIGMTGEQVREVRGAPNQINRTELASGTTEQWVYDSTYLYFRDGRLYAIQTSR